MQVSNVQSEAKRRTWVRKVSRWGVPLGILALMPVLMGIGGCPCGDDADCAVGEFCVEMSCVDCRDNADCSETPEFPVCVDTFCEECVDDADCNDDDACTTDTCDENNECVIDAMTCDDDDACTTDSCDEATGCVFEQTVCDDDDPCTTELCIVGEEGFGGCVFTDVLCEEDENCVDGVCVLLCEMAEDCDDGDLCNGTEDCSADGNCEAGTALNCDDENLCTTDACDAVTGCSNTLVSCPAGEECETATGNCVLLQVETFTLTADASATQAEGDTGTTNFTFTVNRTGATSAKTVDYAVTGGTTGSDANANDFAGAVLPSGSVVYAAGESGNKTITVPVNGDASVEADESFTVTLTDPDDADAVLDTATGTIQNDDTGAAPVNTVPSDASAQVGVTTAIAGVSVSDADNSTLTVNLATSDGLIQFTAIATGASAEDDAGFPVAAGTNKTSITLAGTITNINATLSNLAYTTDRIASDPGTDIITMTSTDSDTLEDIDDISIAVGIQITLTSGADTGTGFVGTAGGDNYIATTATDFGLNDVLVPGNGRDQLQINGFGAAAVPSGGTGGSVASMENLFLNLAVGGANAFDLSKVGDLDTVVFTPAAVSAGNLDLNNGPDMFTFIYRPLAAANDFQARTIDIDIANAVFGVQSFTCRLEGNATQIADFALLASTSGNIETVNIVSTSSDGTADDTITNAITGTSTITVDTVRFTGDQRLNAGTWGGANTKVLDGTGMDAVLTVTSAIAGAVISGGNKGDTLNGGANSQSIAGGPGADTINPGAAADLVQTGTGSDTIVVVIADVEAAGGGVVYDRWQDFTTGSGGDLMDWNTALNINNGAVGPPFVAANYLSGAKTDTVITGAPANTVIFELTGALLANDIIPGTTTSATIEGWAATALASVDHTNAVDEFIIILYDTGTGSDLDAAVFAFSGDVTLTGMLAAEFRLITVIEGVLLNSVTSDNFK